MIRRILPVIVGAAWGLGVYAVGLRLFFPSEKVIERLQYQLVESSAGAWQLQASRAVPWRLTGLSLSDVELLKVDKPTRGRRSLSDDGEDEAEAEAEAPAASRVLVAERIAARLEVLPLLTGSLATGFVARVFKGDLDGTLSYDDGVVTTSAELEDLDVSLLPLDGEALKLDLTGLLHGSWDLVLDTADFAKSTGKIAFQLESLVLTGASFSGFDWSEPGTFPKAALELELTDGKARVRKGELDGDLLEGKLDGDITLNKAIDRSRLRMKAQFKLGETIDSMVKLLPGPRDARRDDGTYHYAISGTLLHPSFRAERERGSLAGRKRPSPVFGGEPGGEGIGAGLLPGGPKVSDDSTDPDERRRLREERIKERRERLRQRREESTNPRERQDAEKPERDREDFDGGMGEELLDDVDLLHDIEDDPDDLRMPPDGAMDELELDRAPFDDLPPEEDFGDEF
ncbi:MAG: type II secretion system protein GspN [Pseudomonadota bacterium]